MLGWIWQAKKMKVVVAEVEACFQLAREGLVREVQAVAEEEVRRDLMIQAHLGVLARTIPVVAVEVD